MVATEFLESFVEICGVSEPAYEDDSLCQYIEISKSAMQSTHIGILTLITALFFASAALTCWETKPKTSITTGSNRLCMSFLFLISKSPGFE